MLTPPSSLQTDHLGVLHSVSGWDGGLRPHPQPGPAVGGVRHLRGSGVSTVQLQHEPRSVLIPTFRTQ